MGANRKADKPLKIGNAEFCKYARRYLLIFIFSFVFFTPLLFASYEISGSSLNPALPQFKVAFIDVGSGNCVFIQTPSGKKILINGAYDPKPSYLVSFLNKKIKPKKKFLGIFGRTIRKIDIVVLTHSEQARDLKQVFENFEVGELIDSHGQYDLLGYKELLKELDKKYILYDIAKRGKVFNWDPLLKVEVLNPPRKACEKDSGDLNNNEIALRMTYNKVSFLFPGNIKESTEIKLAEIYKDKLKSTVIKIPNYGSAESNSEEFVNFVQPEFAVVFNEKCGIEKQVSKEIIKRYEDKGCYVFRNDVYNALEMTNGKLRTTHNGTISVITDGIHYKVESEKNLDEIQKQMESINPEPPEYNFPEIQKNELEKKVKDDKLEVEPLCNEKYFSAACDAIDHAVDSVYMVMFFVNTGESAKNPVNILVKKLIEARQRGVRVKIILEMPRTENDFIMWNNEKVYRWLTNAGVDIKLSSPQLKTHNKFFVVDQNITVVGNHNWSDVALDGTQNEVSVLIKSENVA
ncbi:hypothetical protein KJ633_01895, partial [bacterium]|nr:hypothetical protein [bacterium]